MHKSNALGSGTQGTVRMAQILICSVVELAKLNSFVLLLQIDLFFNLFEEFFKLMLISAHLKNILKFDDLM